MTYEYAQAHKKEIDARILRDAEPIPSVEALPKFLREHGAICVCVVDGKVCRGGAYPSLSIFDLAQTTPSKYASDIVFNGVTLSELIRQRRILATMVPM